MRVATFGQSQQTQLTQRANQNWEQQNATGAKREETHIRQVTISFALLPICYGVLWTPK